MLNKTGTLEPKAKHLDSIVVKVPLKLRDRQLAQAALIDCIEELHNLVLQFFPHLHRRLHCQLVVVLCRFDSTIAENPSHDLDLKKKLVDDDIDDHQLCSGADNPHMDRTPLGAPHNTKKGQPSNMRADAKPQQNLSNLWQRLAAHVSNHLENIQAKKTSNASHPHLHTQDPEEPGWARKEP